MALGSSGVYYLVNAVLLSSSGEKLDIAACRVSAVAGGGGVFAATVPAGGCSQTPYGTVCCNVTPAVFRDAARVSVLVGLPAGCRLVALQLQIRAESGESYTVTVFGARG